MSSAISFATSVGRSAVAETLEGWQFAQVRVGQVDDGTKLFYFSDGIADEVFEADDDSGFSDHW